MRLFSAAVSERLTGDTISWERIMQPLRRSDDTNAGADAWIAFVPFRSPETPLRQSASCPSRPFESYLHLPLTPKTLVRSSSILPAYAPSAGGHGPDGQDRTKTACFDHPAASPMEGARASDSTRRQFCQKGHHLNTQPEPDLPRLALTPNDHPIPHGIDAHYLIKPGGFHYHPVTTTGPSFQPRPELEELVIGNSSLSADVATRGNWAVAIGFSIYSYLRGPLFSFGFFYHFTLYLLLPRVDI